MRVFLKLLTKAKKDTKIKQDKHKMGTIKNLGGVKWKSKPL